MNPKQMQQMAMKMQKQMQKIQEELGNTNIQGTAGGDAVTITMNGHREIQAIAISPEVVDPEDVEMLQDLLLAAINDASKKAQDMAEEKMGPLAGNMQIPGLM
jgi:hypothetical protein